MENNFKKLDDMNSKKLSDEQLKQVDNKLENVRKVQEKNKFKGVQR